MNKETSKDDNFHDMLEIHYIKFSYFKKQYSDIVTVLDRWATFLTKAHQFVKKNLPKIFEEVVIVII